MSRDQIRSSLIGNGPFVIGTSDGKEFSAPHSEFVFVGKHNVIVEQPGGAFDIIDPLHIVSLRPRAKSRLQKAA